MCNLGLRNKSRKPHGVVHVIDLRRPYTGVYLQCSYVQQRDDLDHGARHHNCHYQWHHYKKNQPTKARSNQALQNKNLSSLARKMC